MTQHQVDIGTTGRSTAVRGKLSWLRRNYPARSPATVYIVELRRLNQLHRIPHRPLNGTDRQENHLRSLGALATLSATGKVVKRSTIWEESMSTISDVVHQLETQRKLTQRELEKLNLAIRALTSLEGTSTPVVRRKPKISAAGIARIRAAQKARWAKIKAAK
jgi:hypothetical protein